MHHRATKKKETIIFLHIPKTAGTTLDQIIYQQFRYRNVYQTGLNAQLGVQTYIEMSEKERANYRLLKGHMGFGIHRYVPSPWAYFTFLREPIDRTISHFYYIAQSKNHALYDLIQSQHVDIKAYIEAAEDPMLFNAQTRIISGVWDENPAGTCTLEHLEKAKENLKNQIKIFGLTERFDESLLLIGKALGWRSLYYNRLNITGKRPRKEELDEAVLKAVKSANKLDLELYKFALPLFEAQIQKYGPDFDKAVQRYKFRNRMTSPLTRVFWHMRKISVRFFIQEQLARFSK